MTQSLTLCAKALPNQNNPSFASCLGLVFTEFKGARIYALPNTRASFTTTEKQNYAISLKNI
jgi:hypothetical protein